jgi:uncharacterized membrane protein YvbJ
METKEPFCGACGGVALAFVGAGMSRYGSKETKGSHAKQKKIILWTGVGSILVGLLITYYFLKVKDCGECK